MGIKQLPPSQRKSYRYLKFRIHSDQKVELGEVVDSVWDSALDLLGSRGVAEADFWILGDKFNVEEQEGVIKVQRNNKADIRAALTLINSFSGKKGFIEVQKVSGSLKNLK
jgi:RNase P/RNase MRP subunit POP5